jgi:putative hydrolase of the HAD superfamily
MDIMNKYHYAPHEVLVIGDDPDSEIRAANELGIDTVLYDRTNTYPHADATYRITDYHALNNAI